MGIHVAIVGACWGVAGSTASAGQLAIDLKATAVATPANTCVHQIAMHVVSARG